MPRVSAAHEQEVRERIVIAATRVFGVKGYQGATIADVVHGSDAANGSRQALLRALREGLGMDRPGREKHRRTCRRKRQRNNSHRLLRIIRSVAEAHVRRGGELKFAEDAVDRDWSPRSKDKVQYCHDDQSRKEAGDWRGERRGGRSSRLRRSCHSGSPASHRHRRGSR